MSDTQATFFATLVDEWSRCGITDAVVGAGRRSTLLAGLLEVNSAIRVHVMVDERSASHFALGLSIATGRPAVMWCTSGTATVEFAAAVIEAHHSRVPLLVCTSDRPPELLHVRDWQAVDQRFLYAGSTRWSFDPGVADAAMRQSWRSIAARAFGETLHNPSGPGPVHLNLPIREPWTFDAGELPPGRPNGVPWHTWPRATVRPSNESIGALIAGERKGVIIAGNADYDYEPVHACARALGWPVFAEARSGTRVPESTTIAGYDALLRSPAFMEVHRPDVVVRFGMPVLSKTVTQWLQTHTPEQWLVSPFDEWTGTAGDAANIVRADIDEFCATVLALGPESADASWLQSWQRAERLAQRAIDEALLFDVVTEPFVARSLAHSLPEGSILFASTSMPVRDVEWYAPARRGLSVIANRGVSGLEGMVSTAAGVALNNAGPNVLLTGDLGFLYDLNALWTLKGISGDLQLTIVIVDNDGGGIFDAFPELRGLGQNVYERVTFAPHRTDIVAAVEGLDVPVSVVTDPARLVDTVVQKCVEGGLGVVYVPIDRDTSSTMRKNIHACVASAQ